MAYENDLIEVLEASPIGAAILDDQDQILFWNSPLLDILGGLQEDAFAHAAARAFFAHDSDYRQARRLLAERGHVSGHEVRILRADGLEAWASVTIRAIRFENRPATLVWYYDITQTHQRKQALEASQQALLEVLDNAPVGAALCDGPGRVSYWNNALLDLLGSDDGDLDQRTMTTLIDQAEAVLGLYGPGHTFPVPVGEANRWLAAWRGAITFEGRPSTIIWLQDVTELRTAQEEAERATRMKSSFLATVSHEIRTPMNAVRTLAELLSDTSLSAEQAKMAATIRDSADGLVAVINDILDVSKIEAGRLEVAPRLFNLDRLIDGVVSLLRPKAEEKGIKFRVTVQADLAPWRYGDDMRIRQILVNLLGNAIKFTEQGTVRFQVRQGEAAGALLFEVADTGIGIPPETLPLLFQPFRQAESSTARRFGGTGLGLSICKGLVDLMGGAIEARSVVGRGSQFFLSLPLAEREAPADAQARTQTTRAGRWSGPTLDQAAQRGAVVLCAEDNATNRDVLAHVLDRLGVAHEFAEDGLAALRLLDRGRHGLLLTDGHMPGLDGWELATAIRDQEQRGGLPRLPIIALTADAVRGVEERCQAAGMDDHLTKPLSVEALEAALLRLLPTLADLRSPTEARASDLGPGTVFDVEAHVLDLSGLIDMVGSEFEVIDGMLESFRSSADNLIADLVAAVDLGDAKAIRLGAHALKGAARYVGARKLADAAAAVEEAGQQERLGEARRWAPAFRPIMDELSRAIEKIRVEEQLRRIRQEIGELATSRRGVGAGLELEAVVDITEVAADRILAAAETILQQVDRIASPSDAEAVQGAVMAIFEACSFQDLTSQRVRKAVARLAEIEEKLDAVVRGDAGIAALSEEGEAETAQDDIDKLFA
ncbi:PAS domain-containing hybrid sensor histidine kinase/response regulator [Nitrospirillum pindoramense]|uniref:Sensory/regulatory protein RpfC n=1 Tax=Nitrospirillum amazonense TaxID=28077 RepID=A0A560GX34_9PROT|nr:PAS domain-containing hybrid sensor histidine kinase/response regulator [Nitrospirillum amazonense]TWB38562.1 PAS domain S-box-containing protein [Nitrospirillum amazonense]